MSHFWTRSRRLVVVCAALALLLPGLSCSSGGGGSDDEGEPASNVSLFTAPGEILALTEAAGIDAQNLLATDGGPILFFDVASGFILLLDVNGQPFEFTFPNEIPDLTGEASASPGVMDQILGGSLDGQIILADAVSGLLIRLGLDGVPDLHASEAQVTAATGEASAQMHAPRHLTTNQIFAQDLISKDILRIDTFGNATIFVDADDIAAAADLATDLAVPTGWVRNASGSQFSHFAGNANILRMQVNGTVDQYVSESELEVLFPDFGAVSIVKLATERGSDALYMLVAANDGRGRGIAAVSPDGLDLIEFTDIDDFEISVGGDIIDFGFIAVSGGNFFYAIDGRLASVYTFDNTGVPDAVALPGDFLDATGAPGINASFGAPIDELGLVVIEPESDSFVLVQ